jgi:hypothetical protein
VYRERPRRAVEEPAHNLGRAGNNGHQKHMVTIWTGRAITDTWSHPVIRQSAFQ